jgi:hypothetical protein
MKGKKGKKKQGKKKWQLSDDLRVYSFLRIATPLTLVIYVYRGREKETCSVPVSDLIMEDLEHRVGNFGETIVLVRDELAKLVEQIDEEFSHVIAVHGGNTAETTEEIP